MNIHTVTPLNNGVQIPMLGLGVFQSKDGEETANAVAWALKAGYRHLDTAAVYGNEASVGEGIRRSGIPRNQIFITTKLWNEDQRRGRQRQAFEDSLEKLGVSTVDLYLIHWPVAGKYNESWKVLEQIYADGLARAIGVSNFHRSHLDDLLTVAKVTPAVNQVECHPRLTQEPLRAYCKQLGIAFEAWSPLGGGGAGNLTSNPTLLEIGLRHNKSAAQVMIRWELQHGIITIPKSVHKERIEANADVFGFELNPSEMKRIDGLNQDLRSGPDPDHFDF
ncbi:MAG: aldo/keto reductase [Oscillospiraceae bacterium]|jgi:diketogulonate reductase-like aldo/keto reductase|nr:aldo/keto reductase [Oscillospiraceae bacterium]